MLQQGGWREMDGSGTKGNTSIVAPSKGIHLAGAQTSSGTFLHESTKNNPGCVKTKKHANGNTDGVKIKKQAHKEGAGCH